MTKLSIFISSTCYDLSPIRESIKTTINNLGHSPLLSEDSDFPVSEDRDNIENCKAAIKNYADILILIVGKKRGSIDKISNKSIVNIEYDTAKKLGLDCIVFVDSEVWTYRKMYQDSPKNDFSSVVDSPEIFEFVSRLNRDNNWIVPFTSTDDILKIIKSRLSTRLKELLVKNRANKLYRIPQFEGEPALAMELAVEKPDYWEFMLAHELFKYKFALLSQRYEDKEKGFVFIPSSYPSGKDCYRLLRTVNENLLNAISTTKNILEGKLVNAFNVTHDPIEILNAINYIFVVLDYIYDEGFKLKSTISHHAFRKSFELFQVVLKDFSESIKQIVNDLGSFIENPGSLCRINLVLPETKNHLDLIKEIEDIPNNPNFIDVVNDW